MRCSRTIVPVWDDSIPLVKRFIIIGIPSLLFVNQKAKGDLFAVIPDRRKDFETRAKFDQQKRGVQMASIEG